MSSGISSPCDWTSWQLATHMQSDWHRCHLAFSQPRTTYTPCPWSAVTWLMLRPVCFSGCFHMIKNPSLGLTLSFSPWCLSGVIDGLGVLCLFPCGRWDWGRGDCRGGSAEWGSYWWWLINGLSGGWRPLAVPQYRVSSTGRRGWWALHLQAIPMEVTRHSGTTWFKGKIWRWIFENDHQSLILRSNTHRRH